LAAGTQKVQAPPSKLGDKFSAEIKSADQPQAEQKNVKKACGSVAASGQGEYKPEKSKYRLKKSMGTSSLDKSSTLPVGSAWAFIAGGAVTKAIGLAMVGL